MSSGKGKGASSAKRKSSARRDRSFEGGEVSTCTCGAVPCPWLSSERRLSVGRIPYVTGRANIIKL